VTYQGFYQTGDDLKRVIFKLGEAYLAAPIGARIATNLFICRGDDASTDIDEPEARQTNILPLNAEKRKS